MQIYIAKNGAQTGPFSEEQLHGMQARGLVSPTDLAWHEGLPDWQPLHTLLESRQPSAVPAPSPLFAPAPFAPPSSPFIPPSTFAQPAGPVGVGGWLTFFCVSLTILSPLFVLGSMVGTWTMSQVAFERFPIIKTVLLWENLGLIALLIYGVIVGCMIWSGNPRGRSIARRFLLIRLFGFIGIELVGLLMMNGLPSEIIEGGVKGILQALFQAVIYFTVWWLYFKKSVRVRNTYGEEPT